MEALIIGGTALKAYGSIVEGNARAAQYGAQKTAYDYNAGVAEENARIAYQQAGAREELQRSRARRLLGSQAALTAQSNVDPTSGSPVGIAAQSAADAELDALMLRHEGELQARGYRTQVENLRYEGRVAQSNARYARQAGYLGALSSVVGGSANYFAGAPITFSGYRATGDPFGSTYGLYNR